MPNGMKSDCSPRPCLTAALTTEAAASAFRFGAVMGGVPNQLAKSPSDVLVTFLLHLPDGAKVLATTDAVAFQHMKRVAP